MQNTNNSGIIHTFSLLIVILAVAIVGTFYLVSSNASQIRYYPANNPYTASCPGNRVLFGIPKGRTATVKSRTTVFGRPYPNANVVQTSFMGKPVTVNKKIEPCLKAVEWDLKYVYRTKYQVKVIYGMSEVNNQNPPNYFHAYGAAVDINPAENPFCFGGCSHKMPKSYIKAFKNHGFYWGGNFKTGKDYMHFEWHGQKS